MSITRTSVLLFLIFIKISMPSYANHLDAIDLEKSHEGTATGDNYRYLIDATGNLSANEVMESLNWKSGKQQKIVKNISKGALWMHLRLKNPTQHNIQVKLEHTESRVNKLSLFVFNPLLNNSVRHSHFDLLGPISSRPYPHHRPVFPLTIVASSTIDLYFKFEYLPNVRGAIYTEFKIWKSYAFEKSHLIEVTLLMLFFSIHIVMGVITFFTYIVNRDKVFLFYSFYAFATVGTRAATNGMLGFILNVEHMELSELMLPLPIYQLTIFLFSREFLQVKRVAPKWDMVVKFIILCNIISILLAISGYAHYIGLITEAITACYPIILIVSLICWRRGVLDALFFAIGWTVLLAGGIVTFAARDYGIIEHAPWSYWLAHTGALIEVFLLAGLLLSRVVGMRQAKERVEKKYRDHLKTYSEELKLKVEQQTIELKKAKENAEKEARTDVLTGLTNRRYFMEKSQMAIERAERSVKDIWLVTVDIDFFKNVNDTYGHSAGDVALQVVAKILASSIRNVDIVARLGGEEFGLIIEGGKQQETLYICERLRCSIESASIVYEGNIIPITISIGVAMKKPQESIEQLISRSDKALYQAKKEGRNCVVEAFY